MEAMLQMSIVGLLVPACAAYAAWKLVPRAARRSLAGMALRWPAWPGAWRARVEAAARQPAGACGCDGCDRRSDSRFDRPVANSAVAQPIVLHRRMRKT